MRPAPNSDTNAYHRRRCNGQAVLMNGVCSLTVWPCTATCPTPAETRALRSSAADRSKSRWLRHLEIFLGASRHGGAPGVVVRTRAQVVAPMGETLVENRLEKAADPVEQNAASGAPTGTVFRRSACSWLAPAVPNWGSFSGPVLGPFLLTKTTMGPNLRPRFGSSLWLLFWLWAPPGSPNSSQELRNFTIS